MKTRESRGAILFLVLSWASVLVVVLFSVLPVLAQRAASEPPGHATLDEFFSLPDDAIDLGRAKLLIDRVVDPSVDVSATLIVNIFHLAILGLCVTASATSPDLALICEAESDSGTISCIVADGVKAPDYDVRRRFVSYGRGIDGCVPR